MLAALGALGAAVSARGGDWRFDPALGVSSKEADFRLKLRGYIQGDFRSYPNWDVLSADLRGGDSELRRLRVGIEGEWGRFSFELDADPDDDTERFKDAYGELRLARVLRLRGGNFKLPISREHLTTAKKIDFIERSLLGRSLVPARDWGGMAFGQVGKWISYEAGLFAGDGRTSRRRAGTTAAARVAATPWRGVDLGVSYAEGDVAAEPELAGAPDPVPKGLNGAALSGFRYFESKFVDGRRRRVGLEAYLARGPVGLRGEFLEVREERLGQGPTFEDLPKIVGRGWSVWGTWLLTGEKKQDTVKPRRRFPSGPGAIEIALRYESLDFDDSGPDSGFAGVGNRSRNVRPAADRAFTGGLSWWPIRWVRLMGNVVLERFEDPLLAPEPGRDGDYVTLLGRLQFELP